MSPTFENSIIIVASTAILTFVSTLVIEKAKANWSRGLEKLKTDLLRDMQVQIEVMKKEFIKEINTHQITFAREYEILSYLSQIVPHLIEALNNALISSPDNLEYTLKILSEKQKDVDETISIRAPFLTEEIKELCRELSAYTAYMKIEIKKGTTGDRAPKLAQDKNTMIKLYHKIEKAISVRINVSR
jgi:hypothetical protein